LVHLKRLTPVKAPRCPPPSPALAPSSNRKTPEEATLPFPLPCKAVALLPAAAAGVILLISVSPAATTSLLRRSSRSSARSAASPTSPPLTRHKGPGIQDLKSTSVVVARVDKQHKQPLPQQPQNHQESEAAIGPRSSRRISHNASQTLQPPAARSASHTAPCAPPEAAPLSSSALAAGDASPDLSFLHGLAPRAILII
jgi:hypothetical protein